MTNTTQYPSDKYVLVYKMAYAMALIKKGHKVFTTQPNPRRNDLTMWIFELDETFQQDLNLLLGKE